MSEKKIYISEPEEPAVETVTKIEPKSSRKKSSPKTKEKETISYEAAVARLEEIVRRLEQSREGISLEESMKLYEEGVSLVRRCYQELVLILNVTRLGATTAIFFIAASALDLLQSSRAFWSSSLSRLS